MNSTLRSMWFCVSASLALSAGAAVVDISNATTPAEPANPGAGVFIDVTVGAGNSGRLVGLTQTHWASQGFSVPLDLNGNTLVIDSGGGNEPFRADGPISGSGSILFGSNPAHAIRIGGSVANTYAGTTTVNYGWVNLEKTAGQDALAGSISVGGTEGWQAASLVWAASNQINDAANVTVVQSGSFLDLAGFPETVHSLTLGAGTVVKTGAGGVLTVTALTVGGTSYSNGAYDVDSGFVVGSGYIDVGGVGPPVVTNLPAMPLTPVPSDGAVGVDPATFNNILDWGDCSKATSYRVYLWFSSESKPAEPTATVGISEYTLGADLLSVTNYKWQVVASNVVGATTGAVWTFSTKARWDVSGYITNPNDHVGIGNTANLIGDTIFGWQTWDCAIPVKNNGFTFTLDSGGGNYLRYSGDLSGPGDFTLAGAGGGLWNNPIQIAGSVGNTYGGTTLVHHGTVQLEKSAGDALRGTIIVGDATAGTGARVVWAAGDQINDESDVTLVFTPSTDDGKDTYLDLAGFSDTIASLTLAAGTWVKTGAGGVLTVRKLAVGGAEYGGGFYNSSYPFVQGSGSIVVNNWSGGGVMMVR